MDKAEKLFIKNVEEHEMDFWSVLRLYQISYHVAPVATERNITSYAIGELLRKLSALGITAEVLRETECEDYVEGTQGRQKAY